MTTEERPALTTGDVRTHLERATTAIEAVCVGMPGARLPGQRAILVGKLREALAELAPILDEVRDHQALEESAPETPATDRPPPAPESTTQPTTTTTST